MKIVLAALVASLVLSGCASGRAASAGDGTAAAPVPTGDSGSITGLVIDEEQKPVAGVELGVSGVVASTISDASGAFTLNGVPPGPQTLVAQRLGYLSASQRVTIVVGEILELTLVLKPIQILEPHVETFVDDGFIPLSVGAPSVYQYGNPLQASKTTFQHDVAVGAVAGVVTGVWDTSSPATANRLRLTLEIDEASNFTEGRKQITTRVDDVDLTKDTKLKATLDITFVCTASTDPAFIYECTEDPPNRLFQVVYEQKTRVYTSVFYVDPAPEGFTGLPA